MEIVKKKKSVRLMSMGEVEFHEMNVKIPYLSRGNSQRRIQEGGTGDTSPL